MAMKQGYPLITVLLFFSIALAIRESYAIDAYDAPAPPHGLYFVNYPLLFIADKLKGGKGNTIEGNLDLKCYVNLFRLIYFNRKTFKNTWIASILVPAGRIEVLNDHDEGIGDVTVVFGYWIIDRTGSKTWLSLAQFIDIPTGHFDKNKAANMGSNIWKFRPSIYFGKHFLGKIDLELAAKYNFYTENDKTHTKNGDELSLESYLGYFLRPNALVGAHFDTTIGADNKVNNQKILDSGIGIYRTGLSFDWVFETSGINFKYLVDFAGKNSPEGHLFQTRFSWKF